MSTPIDRQALTVRAGRRRELPKEQHLFHMPLRRPGTPKCSSWHPWLLRVAEGGVFRSAMYSNREKYAKAVGDLAHAQVTKFIYAHEVSSN